MEIAGIAVVVLSFILILVFVFIYRKRPMEGLRSIPALNHLRRALGLAVEDGSRIHVSLGSASLLNPQTASALVGLTMLDQVAGQCASGDRPPVVASGDGSLAILSQGRLRSTFKEANALDQYDASKARMTGTTPFAYAAGAISSVKEESVSANLLVGHFGPEVVLLTDAAEQENAYTIAASNAPTAQAVLYATAEDPLIGEELFAGGAYLQAGPFHQASLRAQDVLRWILVVILLGGALLQMIGIL
jgi:hypothetical protein